MYMHMHMLHVHVHVVHVHVHVGRTTQRSEGWVPACLPFPHRIRPEKLFKNLTLPNTISTISRCTISTISATCFTDRE